MKKGDKVMVYEDPISKEVSEGEATLIESLGSEAFDGREYWKVKFNDGSFAARWVGGKN